MKKKRGKNTAREPGSRVKNAENSRKTILFTEYFPFMGGGQVVFISLIKHLMKYYNIEVLIFSRGELEKELKKIKIRCHFIQPPGTIKYRYFWNSIPFIIKLRNFLKRRGVDLVYANSYFAVKLISIAAGWVKIPVIWHKHIIIEKKFSSYLGFQLRFFSKRVKKVICVSGAVKKSLEDAGMDKKKLLLVYNGIETQKKVLGDRRQRARIRGRYKIKNEFLAGTVGFLRRNKGFDILVRAAGIVKNIDAGIKFIIVGKGEAGDVSHETELKDFVKSSGLKNTVIFAGYRNRFEYLPAFDLFVLPSPNEPFGLVTVEASASGVPVLAFNTGGTKEIIKNNYNGFLVNKVDHRLLAEKIIYLSKNRELLKEAGRNAARVVKEKFTIDNQAGKIRKIINKELGMGSAGRVDF